MMDANGQHPRCRGQMRCYAINNLRCSLRTYKVQDIFRMKMHCLFRFPYHSPSVDRQEHNV